MNLLPALTADAMRKADRLTMETFGVPGFTLMESAGRAAVRYIEDIYGAVNGKHIACFCGKGNNGGDGYVVARVLFTLGAKVTVYSVAEADRLTPDARRNYLLLQQLANHDNENRLHLHASSVLYTTPPSSRFDLLVDALLGTGVQQNLRAPYDELVMWMNACPALVVSLDIPTGLHADTGGILGVAVEADLTITMGALKTGLLLEDGPRYAGQIEVAEIGIPEFIFRACAEDSGCAQVITENAVKHWLPRRTAQAHKYSVGMTLVIAGSPGLTGAATLACTAAARSGAGAVICATPEHLQPILAQKMTEVMTIGLPETDGGIDGEKASDRLAAPMEKATALLVGCGMGPSESNRGFARKVLTTSPLPAVIDADGLNAFSGHTDLFAAHAGGRWILTPHVGEFKRLAGANVDLEKRIETVRKYAQVWQCILILKGMPGLVGIPSGKVYINTTGNRALATAGTGDVLAGLCAGLLAQGLSPEHAALCALFIGGAGADRYVQHHSPLTLLASDLIGQARIVIDHLNS